MNILGIHDGHNASACLLEDGVLTWAVQEERYTHVKNQPGIPVNAMREILSHVDEIDQVALASYFIHEPEWYTRQDFWEYTKRDYYINKLVWPFKKRIDPYFRNRLETRVKRLSKTLTSLDRDVDSRFITPVEHHLCHAAAAYYGSHHPPGEPVTVLTADGSGDGLSATLSYGDEEGQLHRVSTSDRNASIGQVYSVTTYILGFRPWEHEYKLMGLAPYSQVDEELLTQLLKLITVDKDSFVANKANMKFLYDYLTRLYRRKRFDHVCATLQKWFEVMMTLWVSQEPEGLFACGGGDFMNVKANQVLAQLPNVSDLFVFPSCGDESTSIGAAYHVYAQDRVDHGIHPKNAITPITSLALGSPASHDYTEYVLEKSGFEWWREKHPERYVVDVLRKMSIVARCSSRMEFGARALGNRSILCDASNLMLKHELNRQVKHRDFWMPFAPSMRDEDAPFFLDNPKHLQAPYMVLAFDSTDSGRRHLQAAMHPYDYTVRPQVVEKGNDYYNLLNRWHRQSGSGAVLNTSFNRHGWPICRTADDALWTLENTGLQHLIIDNYVVVKS